MLNNAVKLITPVYCVVPENIYTTPIEGIGFSTEGGVQFAYFSVGGGGWVGGCTRGKYFQRVLVMHKRVTKKKHNNLFAKDKD